MNTLDISRLLEQPRKRYVAARLQQGRVLLDADASEQQYLADAESRRVTTDLIGKGSADAGFSLGSPVPPLPADLPDQTEPLEPLELLREELLQLGGELTPVRPVSVRAGTFYLGGMRLVLERPEHIALQRDYLQLRPENLPRLPEPTEEEPNPKVPLQALYYLHAWEQTVSAVEDPEIFEVAFGEDTTGRMRRMRRVEVFSDFGGLEGSCTSAWRALVARLTGDNGVFDVGRGLLSSKARLSLRFTEGGDGGNCTQCIPTPELRFLGADHHTVRLQLVAADRFVWAFDNASRLRQVEVSGLDDPEADVTVRLVAPPEDVSEWMEENRVVEILPFGAILDGSAPPGDDSPFYKKVAERTGAFARVARGYDPESRTLVLERGPGTEAMRAFVSSWDSRHPAAKELNFDSPDGSRPFYLRAWHLAPVGGEIFVQASSDEFGPSLPGTNIVPVFRHPGRPGDYWIVSSRPGTRYPAVPFDLSENPAGVPPHGPVDSYAPLGLVLPLVRPEGEAPQKKDRDRVGDVTDCRPPITRLSDRGCVTVTVGDGFTSHGDFTSIQEAIDALPSWGGVVQLREGTFRERVRVVSKKYVTIEGCGSNVVWESPFERNDPLLASGAPDPATFDLISIEQSEHITLRGFVVQSVGDRAVHVHQGSRRVELLDLGVRAGARSGDDFQLGTTTTAMPLFELEGGYAVNCRRSVFEASGRPAVRGVGCHQMVLEDLTFTGLEVSELSPTAPLLAFETCQVLSLRNSVLSTFGQVGVRLTNPMTTDAEIRDVTIISGEHRTSSGQARTSPRSGIDVEGASRVRISGCSVTFEDAVSEHAGIVVQGDEIFVENCRVEVLGRCLSAPTSNPLACDDFRPRAWGGVQVRGGSKRVSIRENRIWGGVGHGVTLGSVVWVAPNAAGIHQGAGLGQLVTRSDGQITASGTVSGNIRNASNQLLRAEAEGPIQELSVVGNRIERMNGSGISVLSLLGMPNPDDIIEITGLCVESNTIVDNLRAPYDQMGISADVLPFGASLADSGLAVQRLPAGGIVLGAVTQADVSGNVILDNGGDIRLPISGVFVLIGDALRITGNRILRNGGRAPLDSPTSPPAGIQPGVRAGIAVLLAGTGATHTWSGVQGILDSFGVGLAADGSSLRVIDNVVRHPEGRALQAVGTGPMVFQGNTLGSEGNHGADTVADGLQIGDVVYVMNLGHPWETEGGPGSPGIGSYNRPFTQGNWAITDLYMQIGSPSNSPRNFVGRGGGLLFQQNQVLLDWEVRRTPKIPRTPLAHYPVALISLDQASVDNNQFSFRLRGHWIPQSPPVTPRPIQPYPEPVIAQALVLGATVNVSNNRFSEALGDTLLSVVCLSELLSNVTFNQTTHEFLVFNHASDTDRSPPQGEWSSSWEHVFANQVLFTRKAFPSARSVLLPTLKSFLQLLWRRD